MVEGVSAMLPVSSVHVVPLVAADAIPLPLRSRDISKKYDCRGTASTTPKYGDILHELTVESTQQVKLWESA